MSGDKDTTIHPEAGTGPNPGPAIRGGAGSLAFDNPREDTYRVRVTGPLDTLTGNRLMRLIEARLRVIAVAGSPTRAIMVDLTHADPVPRAVVDALRHADDACRAAGITFALLGAARLPADVRQALSRIPSPPGVDTAVAAAPDHVGMHAAPTRRAEDPRSTAIQ